MNKDFFMSYGAYYNSGLYSARYKDSIPLRSFNAVKNMILKSALKKKDESSVFGSLCIPTTLRVLDYGCGNGRYFEVLKDVAAVLRISNLILEVTGVDPIKEGLYEYKRKLIERKFSMIEDTDLHDRDGFNSNQFGIFENKMMNMRVRLVKNCPESDLNKEFDLIGMHDCGLCMFGVLSHIPSNSRRIDTMHILSLFIRDSVLFTVPNAKRCFLEEQEEFKSRDIFYSRNSEVRNFYHLYTKDEIESSVNAIKAKIINGIFSANILDETILVRYKFIDIIDSFLCENMPSLFVEYFCKYFLFELQVSHDDTSDERAQIYSKI